MPWTAPQVPRSDPPPLGDKRSMLDAWLDFVYCDLDTNPEGDFDDVDTADPEADCATFEREVRLARETAAGRSLDDTFVHPLREVEMDVRWVYVHVIEEYARHNGHADLRRERIDGHTGM